MNIADAVKLRVLTDTIADSVSGRISILSCQTPVIISTHKTRQPALLMPHVKSIFTYFPAKPRSPFSPILGFASALAGAHFRYAVARDDRRVNTGFKTIGFFSLAGRSLCLSFWSLLRGTATRRLFRSSSWLATATQLLLLAAIAAMALNSGIAVTPRWRR